jgi:metal-responsive CopG/Arc/MetJ family transcriptional regulator
MAKIIPIGISLPKILIDEIDVKRKDVPRSRFLLRILEKSLQETIVYEKEKNSRDQSGLSSLQSSELSR